MATKSYPTLEAHRGAEHSPAFVVHYPHEGSVYVVGFDSFMDLLDIVTSYRDEYDEPLDHGVINRIVDFVEEAVEADDITEAVLDCDCELCRSFPPPVVYRSSPFLRWTVAFLTFVVAYLCWRRNG